MPGSQYIPYCGAPPVPGSAHWNLDPALVGALLAIGLLYALDARRSSASRRQVFAFWIGWAVLTLALISPLCNLSVALFSARIAQHMLIVLVAMPLLVIGGADLMVQRAAGVGVRQPNARFAAAAVIAFSAALWVWHLPRSYDATFHSDGVYWTMHITMAATALALWHVILRGGLTAALVASVATAVQMSGLGAILTLAPRALYEAHMTTTWPWGMSPLEDQALGGIIMWVPGGLILTLIVLAGLSVHLHKLDLAEQQR